MSKTEANVEEETFRLLSNFLEDYESKPNYHSVVEDVSVYCSRGLEEATSNYSPGSVESQCYRFSGLEETSSNYSPGSVESQCYSLSELEEASSNYSPGSDELQSYGYPDFQEAPSIYYPEVEEASSNNYTGVAEESNNCYPDYPDTPQNYRPVFEETQSFCYSGFEEASSYYHPGLEETPNNYYRMPNYGATMEGFTTGIPTRTTPTLTPTTLRNIEQTFIELQSAVPNQQQQHEHQAGFVPPIVPHNTGNAAAITSTYNPVKDEPLWYAPPSQCSVSSKSSSGSSTKATGRMGGRRPNKHEKLSPEEEERRKVRRERNKMAAARCRKRRLDHTNMLVEETEGLEDTKMDLQKEIQELQSQKEHLEFILQAHKCVFKGRKSASGNNNNNTNNNERNINNHHEHNNGYAATTSAGNSHNNHMNLTTSNVVDMPPMTTSPTKLARPTSLPIMNTPVSYSVNVGNRMNNSVITSVSDMAGIPISTPSTGMFNFEAMMEGGTGLTPISSGLTPVIPTCSSQQRSSSSDLSSPDTMNGPKLVSL